MHVYDVEVLSVDIQTRTWPPSSMMHRARRSLALFNSPLLRTATVRGKNSPDLVLNRLRCGEGAGRAGSLMLRAAGYFQRGRSSLATGG